MQQWPESSKMLARIPHCSKSSKGAPVSHRAKLWILTMPIRSFVHIPPNSPQSNQFLPCWTWRSSATPAAPALVLCIHCVCSFVPSMRQIPRDYKSKKYIEEKCGEGLMGWRRRWKGLGPQCWPDTREEEGQEAFRLQCTPKDASSRQRGHFWATGACRGVPTSWNSPELPPYPGLFFSREFLSNTYYRIAFFVISLPTRM